MPSTFEAATCATPSHGPLERVLFAASSTVTLASVTLAAAASPWFLLVTAFVGVNQGLYALRGACPASMILRRVLDVDGAVRAEPRR